MARRNKQKSEFLSAFGKAFEVFKAISDAVIAEGGGDDDLRRVLSEDGLPEEIAKVILHQGGKRRLTNAPAKGQGAVEPVRPTLAGLIALGRYDYVNPDITAERFPVESDGTDGEPVIFYLGRDATTDEVLAEMDKQGLKPARIEHPLVYGAKNPEEQRKYPIVCLGSSWLSSGGYRRFPCLGGSGGERRLGLGWDGPGDHWDGRCRFLALRK